MNAENISMTEQYLKKLIENTEQKKAVLIEIKESTARQAKAMQTENPDWKAFDAMLDEKGELIDRLNAFDDAFNAMFDRIKDELLANKAKYKMEINRLQELIREVTSLSTSIQADELRNRDLVTSRINESRQKIRQDRKSVNVTGKYYNAMNKINLIDPQLMDTKK
ncbi:MAG: hypothetical protein K6G19_08085 [Lachnospiraceae bacterium]|nr:hypothetical protein [Lachnospiraceae bacterium]